MVNEELLPQGVLRQIGDKLYEKRKMAALEVEQIVKRLAGAGDTAKISAIIDKLIAEFAFSPQANHRKVCVCGGGDRAQQQRHRRRRREQRQQAAAGSRAQVTLGCLRLLKRLRACSTLLSKRLLSSLTMTTTAYSTWLINHASIQVAQAGCGWRPPALFTPHQLALHLQGG